MNLQMTTMPTRRTLTALAALACALIALVGAGSAPGDIVAPVVTLGPTTVANGVATVSGTITATDPSSAQLSVNGQPLGLDAAGAFAGTVNLNGQSNLSLAVRNPANGEVSTVSIPLTTNLVGPGGVISPTVLSGLGEAVASITRPIGGFVSVGGQPISVSGGVGNTGQLASLSINGIDALSLLHPNGTFVVPVPGTNKEVTVLMTDRQGVSIETRYPAAQAAWISARNAVGVRIASIRYFTKGIKKTKRVRMVVTVKDRRGLLVRGAKISVRSMRAALVRGRTKARSSNQKGQAAFTMSLRSKAFGKRLVVMATAKTPTAKASRRSSVRLPRLARAHR
jgi:hypothetical protein